MSFKRFLIWSPGGPTGQWSKTIYGILKEGIIGNIHVKLYEIWTIMGNIHVKLYEIWTSGSGGDVV